MFDFIDAHCHFSRAAFDEYSGAGRFVCNAVTCDDWDALVSALCDDERIFAAIGIHPWHADTVTADALARMNDLLARHPQLMVGETGLDYTRENRNMQNAAFRAQYEMAAALGRAVHIHCVRAWDDMMRFLRTMPTPPVIVFHRFSGSPEIMSAICKHIGARAYFSFWSPDSERARQIALSVPAEQILVESDAFAPAPVRIQDTIGAIATVRGVPMDEMAGIIYNNTIRMIEHGQIAQNS